MLALNRHYSKPTFVLFAALFTSLILPTLSQAELQLVPQPRELEAKSAIFRVTPATRILVLSGSEEDRFAAKSLQEELKSPAGKTVPLVTSQQGAKVPTIILGR